MHASNEVIMPALGMVQTSGKIVRWLIQEGQAVEKGQPLFEVETDKAVAEVEAPLSGILSQVKANEGDDVPVGEVIALILTPGSTSTTPNNSSPSAHDQKPSQAETGESRTHFPVSPIAARIAAENGIDISRVHPKGSRVEKADVLAFLESRSTPSPTTGILSGKMPRPLASPKARRLAAERGIHLASLKGSGPQGAVLAGDIPMTAVPASTAATTPAVPAASTQAEEFPMSTIWRIMVERTTAAWKDAPHFFLLREVDAGRLVGWREALAKKNVKVTYTDLLVKLVAEALKQHPRVNAAVRDGKVYRQPEINIGLAVAVEDGLVVPVIHRAGELGPSGIAAARTTLLERARQNKLRPEDISGGTFTISNLGMYGVDTFLAVLNPPQAAILAVGRIADRVVPVNGQPAVRPMMSLSLSCDHRALDGARAAQFLDTLAGLIEEPLGLIE